MANWEKDSSIFTGNLKSGLDILIFPKGSFLGCIFCPTISWFCMTADWSWNYHEKYKSRTWAEHVMPMLCVSWCKDACFWKRFTCNNDICTVENFHPPKKCAQPLGCPDIQRICTFRLDMNLISSICWVILTEFITLKFISIWFFNARLIPAENFKKSF